MMFDRGCRWIYEMDAAGMMAVSRSCRLLLAAAAAMDRDRRRAFLCLVQVQHSTKEIKTTDVSCKSNALKHEDDADHTSI
ncbi:unnamed protein product [Sphagnum balticum]